MLTAIRINKLRKYMFLFFLCICIWLFLYRSGIQIDIWKEFATQDYINPRLSPIKVFNGLSNSSNSNSKWDFIVDTETCKIPEVSPFDESIKHLLGRHPKSHKCNDIHVITYIDNGVLYLNITRKHKGVKYCRYRAIHLKQNEFMFGNESQPFETSSPVKDEFIKVTCYNSSYFAILNNFHINFIYKFPRRDHSENNFNFKTRVTELNEIYVKPSDTRRTRLNVLLIMFDSTSRINSMRYLTQTRRYLTETMGAVEMLGYHKLADNTFVNLMPLLTGEFSENLPCVRNTTGLDDCPFVWKSFADNNYLTHFGEDWPFTGAFHFNRPGFKKQPTDYYDRPFYMANDMGSRSPFDRCFHGKSEPEILQKRIIDLASQLKHGNYFSLSVFTRNTHNSLSGLSSLDEITKVTLSKLYENNYLNQTFVALFGDHGMRFGKVRPTFIGQLEERLPMMFIFLPTWFKNQYIHYVNNLIVNSRRVTTHFDMHSTLVHLLDIDRPFIPKDPKEKGISLFQEIPPKRSCEDASILPHWCTCNFHKTVKDNSTIKTLLASTLINHLNMLVAKYKNKCKQLSVMEILYAVKIHSKVGNVIHRIVIQTDPGKGLFEATVEYNQTYNRYNVIGDVSRLNTYQGKSDCIKDNLRKICACK